MSHYTVAQHVFREEINGLRLVLEAIRPDFDQAVEMCLSCHGKVVVAGIGKSGIIAHKIAATLASTGTAAVYLNAGEALHGDMGIVESDDVVFMLSNSAATPELLRMLPSIRRIGAKIIGCFGQTKTTLALDMDVCLHAHIEREACPLNLAPMTSSTVALVVGDALAAALMRARKFKKEDFAVFHPGGNLGRRLLYRVSDVMIERKNLPVVSRTHTLREAVEALGRGRLGAVLVCDEEDHLLGIFVEADVRRQYLNGTSGDVSVESVMSKDPIFVSPEQSLGDALEQMEQGPRKVYVVPVVAEDARVVGLLRMHDIVSK